MSSQQVSKKHEKQLMQNADADKSTLLSADLIRTIAILLIILLHAAAFPPEIPTEITPQVMYGWFTADVYAA
jgi:peptidoglycan/LPS O-acetylase OafA/YrhL